MAHCVVWCLWKLRVFVVCSIVHSSDPFAVSLSLWLCFVLSFDQFVV